MEMYVQKLNKTNQKLRVFVQLTMTHFIPNENASYVFLCIKVCFLLQRSKVN